MALAPLCGGARLRIRADSLTVEYGFDTQAHGLTTKKPLLDGDFPRHLEALGS